MSRFDETIHYMRRSADVRDAPAWCVKGMPVWYWPSGIGRGESFLGMIQSDPFVYNASTLCVALHHMEHRYSVMKGRSATYVPCAILERVQPVEFPKAARDA